MVDHRWVMVLLLWAVLVGVGLGDRGCGEVLISKYKGSFTACVNLPKLGCTLAWTIHNATNSVDFAFSGSVVSGGWVGWGINPTAQAMEGTQALVAFQSSQGRAVVHTYAITGAMKRGAPIVPGNISLAFTRTSAVIAGGEATIFATLSVSGQSWTMNHVWNRGTTVDVATNALGPHTMSGDSLSSVSSINLATNQAFTNVNLPHQKLKNRHAITGAVAWGLLLPLGVMAARYLRPLSGSNPAWFVIHVTCQCTGYLLGVASWAMGLKLHSYHQGGAKVHSKHRNVGITIFALTTLQVLALVLRPRPDGKYRQHWNVYHHVVGYTAVVLIVVNIFEGLEVLNPGEKWSNAYIVVVTVLGGTSLVMEIITWRLWLRHRAKKNAAAGVVLPSQRLKPSRDHTAASAALRNGRPHDKTFMDAAV